MLIFYSNTFYRLGHKFVKKINVSFGVSEKETFSDLLTFRAGQILQFSTFSCNIHHCQIFVQSKKKNLFLLKANYFVFQTVIDKAHPLFHLAAASDPNMILEKDPVLRPMLENQRAHGK